MIHATFKVQTVGEILKDARLNRGLNIKQVAESTRIRAEYLEALEKGDYGKFPSEVYIKGFLKNYAKFLDVDVKRALALYRRENKEIKKAHIKKPESPSSRFDFTLTPGKLIVAIVVIVFIGIIYYIATQIGTILEAPNLEISSPTSVSTDESKEFQTADESIDIKGAVSAGATLTINGDEVTTNNLEQFEIKDLRLNLGENEFVLLAESQFGRESRAMLKVIRIEAKEEQRGETEIEPEEEQAENMSVTITIGSEDANVLVITDGQTQINRVLVSGDTREFEANKTVAIQTPRPSSVKININGEDFSILTSKRHEWTLENGEVTKTK